MSKTFKFSQIAMFAIMAASLAVTGCSSKKSASEIVVAPMGVPYGNQGGYDGGDLMGNSADIINAASGLPKVVYFGFDKSDITSSGANVLNQNANFMNANPSARVLVAGNTDERGSREYNMALGERRALAVKNYLTSQGVSPNNIETISYGEERPAVQGNTEAAYAKNRRAELSY